MTNCNFPIKQIRQQLTPLPHAALSHTDKQGSYVRMLCVNFSLAFSTILPNILTKKLTDGFLPDHPQAVRVGPSTHSTLRTGLPQGYWVPSCSRCVHMIETPPPLKHQWWVSSPAVRRQCTGRRSSDWSCGVWSGNNLMQNTSKLKELVTDRRGKESTGGLMTWHGSPTPQRWSARLSRDCTSWEGSGIVAWRQIWLERSTVS